MQPFMIRYSFNNFIYQKDSGIDLAEVVIDMEEEAISVPPQQCRLPGLPLQQVL